MKRKKGKQIRLKNETFTTRKKRKKKKDGGEGGRRKKKGEKKMWQLFFPSPPPHFFFFHIFVFPSSEILAPRKTFELFVLKTIVLLFSLFLFFSSKETCFSKGIKYLIFSPA